MSNFRRTSQGANDVQFANPADMTDKLRVVVRHSPKQVGPFQRTNVKSEVISTRRDGTGVDDKCCGPEAYDATSIRTQISGSLENKVKVLAQLNQHIANIELLKADLVAGFVPYDAELLIIV